MHVARNEYVVNSLKETFQKLTRRRTHRKESTYSTKSTEDTGKSTDISFSDPLPERVCDDISVMPFSQETLTTPCSFLCAW